MTAKIVTTSEGGVVLLRLSGRLESQILGELEAQLWKHLPALVLDLDEVTLVDVTVVRFLNACEERGIELVNVAPYIRAWMTRARAPAE